MWTNQPIRLTHNTSENIETENMSGFVFIELPSFCPMVWDGTTFRAQYLTAEEAKDCIDDHMQLFHEVRKVLKKPDGAGMPAEIAALGKRERNSLGWEGWTASSSSMPAYAAEQMLTSFCMYNGGSPDQRCAPKVKAVLLKEMPCPNSVRLFLPGGQGTITPPAYHAITAAFVPRSGDKQTPVFYLTPNCDAAKRDRYWDQLGSVFADNYWSERRRDLKLPTGALRMIDGGDEWYAINGQEQFKYSKVADMAKDQGREIGYWIGRH